MSYCTATKSINIFFVTESDSAAEDGALSHRTRFPDISIANIELKYLDQKDKGLVGL
jgi:hypothetical protein